MAAAAAAAAAEEAVAEKFWAVDAHAKAMLDVWGSEAEEQTARAGCPEGEPAQRAIAHLIEVYRAAEGVPQEALKECQRLRLIALALRIMEMLQDCCISRAGSSDAVAVAGGLPPALDAAVRIWLDEAEGELGSGGPASKWNWVEGLRLVRNVGAEALEAAASAATRGVAASSAGGAASGWSQPDRAAVQEGGGAEELIAQMIQTVRRISNSFLAFPQPLPEMLGGGAGGRLPKPQAALPASSASGAAIDPGLDSATSEGRRIEALEQRLLAEDHDSRAVCAGLDHGASLGATSSAAAPPPNSIGGGCGVAAAASAGGYAPGRRPRRAVADSGPYSRGGRSGGDSLGAGGGGVGQRPPRGAAAAAAPVAASSSSFAQAPGHRIVAAPDEEHEEDAEDEEEVAPLSAAQARERRGVSAEAQALFDAPVAGFNNLAPSAEAMQPTSRLRAPAMPGASTSSSSSSSGAAAAAPRSAVGRRDSGERRKGYNPWTEEEENRLVEGFRKYPKRWETIRGEFQLEHRTGVQLKDKWRNLVRAGMTG